MKPIKEKDLKAYAVEDYPYMVTKKYGEPHYHRSHKEAVSKMTTELIAMRDTLKRYDEEGVTAAVGGVLDQVSALPLEGGTVSGVVDPYTGVKYQATLVKREGF